MTDENINKQLKKLGVDPKQARNDLRAKDNRLKQEAAVKEKVTRIKEQNYYQERGIGGMGGLGPNYRSQELALTAKANAARISPTKPKVTPPSPPVKPAPKYTPAGGGMGGRRGSGSSPKSGTRTPQISARNPSASNAKQKVLGMTS